MSLQQDESATGKGIGAGRERAELGQQCCSQVRLACNSGVRTAAVVHTHLTCMHLCICPHSAQPKLWPGRSVSAVAACST